MSIAGVILAAGESRRMGFPKALLMWDGETFLDRLILEFSRHCSPVIAVLGADAERIGAGIRYSRKASMVVNPDYRSGQLSSLQCGLRRVPEEVDGVVFTLVDHPAIRPTTLAALLKPPRPLIRIPRYEGRRGHPVFFSSGLIGEFLSLTAGSAARDVIHRYGAQTEYVDLDDEAVVLDIDYPEDYRRLTKEALP